MSPLSSIAHYRISAKIGEGGMGAVYRATDTKLNRDVAIKVLPDSFAADPDRLARFQREAYVLASLNHPNIASIYGLEERALVLELVEGPTLAERIAQGPIPVDDALPMARQIAEALEYAHEKGVVHRDLKPANIKLAPDGRVKVLDFGLAKALANDGPGADPSNSPTITMRATMAGMIMGTAGYMSPEQAKGKPVDRRADIWAYGVLLVEMLTGRALYAGETVSETLAAVIKDTPDLSSLPQETPVSVRRMIERCLDKDPLRRLQSIGEARIAIDDKSPAQPTPPSSAPPSRLPWVLAVVLGILLVAAGVSLWRAGRPLPQPLLNLSLDVGEQDPPTPVTVFTPLLSPDGSRVAFAGKVNGKVQLATRTLAQPNWTTLPGTIGASAPFFSPEGQSIAFFAEGKLKKIAIDGGGITTLCDAPAAFGGSWGENGEIVVSLQTARPVIERLPSAGGTPQPLTQLDTAGGETYHRWPQILPGRKAVLFTVNRGTGRANNAVAVQDLTSGQHRIILEAASFGRYVASGHLIFTRLSTVFAVPMDLASLQTTGQAVPILEQVRSSTLAETGIDFSQDGKMVYATGPGGSAAWSVFRTDPEGKTVALGTTPSSYYTPNLSPDGRRLAMSKSNATGADVMIHDMARDVSVRLTSQPGRSRWPTWTPDGRVIIFNLEEQGPPNLFWVLSDGSMPPRRLTQSKNRQVPYAVSPDGKILIYGEVDDQQRSRLWSLPLEWADREGLITGKPEPLMETTESETDASFSPDGRWLAYSAENRGERQVYVRPFPIAPSGGRWPVSPPGGAFPRWSRTAKELFFMNDYHVFAVSYRVGPAGFEAEKPRLWSPQPFFMAGASRNYDIYPDGRSAIGSFDFSYEPMIKPFTHINFVLNMFDELRRRAPAGK